MSFHGPSVAQCISFSLKVREITPLNVPVGKAANDRGVFGEKRDKNSPKVNIRDVTESGKGANAKASQCSLIRETDVQAPHFSTYQHATFDQCAEPRILTFLRARLLAIAELSEETVAKIAPTVGHFTGSRPPQATPQHFPSY